MSFRKVGICCFVLSTVIGSVVCFSLAEMEENFNKTNADFNVFDNDLVESARRKRKKGSYIMPILFGALMIKSVILPLAFKAMAVMTSVAVLLSTMSLIISSIVGYAKLAWKSEVPAVKVVHLNDAWAKEDDVLKGYIPDSIDYDPNSIPLEQVHYAK